MVARGNWYGDYNDPTTFLDISRTGDGNNDRKYSSKEYDGLLDQAERTTDRQERARLLSEAERLIVENDLPILPIFQMVEMYMYDPHRLTGITSHPRQEQDIDEMDILGDGVGADVPHERALSPAPPSASKTGAKP